MKIVASSEAEISQFRRDRFRLLLFLVAVFAFAAVHIGAQSPNTATMIVTVVDQNDAVVAGADISVVNTATGAVRDAVSGGEGSATIAALSLTGEYKVSVAKTGFTADDVTGLTLRSGETATEYDRDPVHSYQRERRNGTRSLQLHFSTAHTPAMLEIIRHSGRNITSIPKHLITSGFSSCYSRLDGDMTSVTITVNFVHPASNRCIHPVCDRALTPREGARLQSFDDDFEFAGNRSQIVKQIGNAVPPLLGRAIGEALATTLGN